ncbi:response regulator transcription factor [Sulfurimonas sp.]|uniref:response regulator transcription factor n=1 Tax=Sulfurimonas sp. TaxID=2022749 RepID=UPI00356A5D94
MKKIILFTNMTSIKKHWQNALFGKYLTVSIDSFDALTNYLKATEEDIIIMLDELSVSDIDDSLLKLEPYHNATILIFHSLPEVHHAAQLLKQGIKGYENSYIAKENLLTMLKGIENGYRWLFTDLTNFVINKYVQTIDKREPEFLHLLTQKEKDIALMIADGYSNKEIAKKQKIALSTVKGHIRHIFEKAGVSDRISLALQFR